MQASPGGAIVHEGPGRVIWVVMAAVMVVMGLPAEAGRADLQQPKQHTTPMIVVLKDDVALRAAVEMCSGDSRSGSHTAKISPGLGKHCKLGSCRHIYSTSIKGVAGDFTVKEMHVLRRCIPDGIKYVENDALVQSTQGPYITYTTYADQQNESARSDWNIPSSTTDQGNQYARQTTPIEQDYQSDQNEEQSGSIDQTDQIDRNDRSDQNEEQSGSIDQADESDQDALNSPGLSTDWGSNNPEDKEETSEGGGEGEEDEADEELEEEEEVEDNDEPVQQASGTVENSTAPVPKINQEEVYKLLTSPGRKSQRVHIALWNLDRLDQRTLPLDGLYHYGSEQTVGTGLGVTIYLLDSGVRTSHKEFKAWMGEGSRVHNGHDFVDDDAVSEDCQGHGTHVASIAIGKAVGVAKQARVVAVRVLGCDAVGNLSTLVAGLDWVGKNHQKPAVVGMSLGVDVRQTDTRVLQDAVKSLVNDHGVPAIVAAGNFGQDTCNYSPGNVEHVITVAASNLGTKFGTTSESDNEGIYQFSNTGKCVDLFAPGSEIFAACGGPGRCEEVSDESYGWSSGTSMAMPHVAGVAATYLGDHPKATPKEVKNVILSMTTKGKLDASAMLPDTPNRLLYSGLIEPIDHSEGGD